MSWLFPVGGSHGQEVTEERSLTAKKERSRRLDHEKGWPGWTGGMKD